MADPSTDAIQLPDALSLADASTHQFDPDEPLQPVETRLPADIIVTTKSAIADMVADAVAAAVAVQSPSTSTVELRQAAHAALTEETL